MQDTHTTRSRGPAHTMTRRLVGGLAGVTLAAAAMQVTTPSAQASTSEGPAVTKATSITWKAAVTDANTALSRALTKIAHGHYAKATKQLRIMKRKTQAANTAATALVGKPPTDPESDDPPGVTAVLKVSGLDHRITMALVPLFADPHGVHVVPPLGKGLLMADNSRDAMLDTVMALNAGKLDDYVDDLSDTMPVYDQELTAMANQLGGDHLTAGGRSYLTRAQEVVSKTQAAMEKVFGGEERTPRPR